ncbi:MAG: OstA-like protein [Muribaculaceae bacterium]
MAICLFNNIFSETAWAQNKTTANHAIPSTTKITKRHPEKINNSKRAKITPQIPSANRYQKNKLFLENADVLSADYQVNPDYQVLNGNVKFRKEGMFMWCDSAHFYEKTNSLDAFGHVKMQQGDTLFVYADVLYYSGDDELAQLRYNVKMINRDVTLITDSLDYDMRNNYGYYFEGGKIVDSQNELSSVYGQYEPNTKNAEFLYDVELVNEKYVLSTDTLHYNTASHIADILGKTTIVSDSNIIYSRKGWYNTEIENSALYERSRIVTKGGQTVIGDTIYYDRNTGIGEALGNIVLTDSIRQSILDGDYGYHNEKTNSSFATGRARAREFSQGDTLHLHGDTLRTYLNEDSLRVLLAYHRVRFYRSDVQGVCDSMSFAESDSILNMYNHSVVWSGERQITGNEINVHLNDSTVDWATLPDFGFVAEHIEDIYFNQLTGKSMKAYFIDKELRQLDVSGNVLLLTYPMENDSTYNKLITAEGSYMIVKLKPKQQIDKMTLWPDVSGRAIPLFLARKNDFYLEGFKWYDTLRPTTPQSIFGKEDEMNALMQEEAKSARRRKKMN